MRRYKNIDRGLTLHWKDDKVISNTLFYNIEITKQEATVLKALYSVKNKTKHNS